MTKKQLIFMGPPASGKGTQTKMLAEKTGFPHVDTGSLLRASIKNEAELGKIAKSYIEKGQLAPADLVASIIKERLLQNDCKNGYILDGYPRSLEQALMLDEIMKEINQGVETEFKAICFDIPDDMLLERIVNRRSCPKCGKIYNTKFLPPKVDGICDDDGEVLVQRKDDTEEVAKTRFETYYAQTEPLIDFYTKRGNLVHLDATGSTNEIFEKLLKLL
ncbi:adenylate kinase [bacterium]|nr:adenylate kinase [bacterium]